MFRSGSSRMDEEIVLHGPNVMSMDYRGWRREARGRWLRRSDVIAALEWMAKQDVSDLTGSQAIQLAIDSLRKSTDS